VAGIRLDAGDFVHVSGYGLLEATNGRVLAPWLAALRPEHAVLLDPGPLVRDIPSEVWAVAAARADWISCSLAESQAITGETDPAEAAAALSGMARRGALVRLGPEGCLLAVDGTVTAVAGFAVEAVDTNGAGDAHAGAFLAALARGAEPLAAAKAANACAAIAVTRRGPATAPTLAEVERLLR
jgi:sugar/nucleoside kinase (ribokinase family)